LFNINFASTLCNIEGLSAPYLIEWATPESHILYLGPGGT